MSSCHNVIMSSCAPVILSSYHPVILSSRHPIILSSFHPVILSQCHPMKNTIKTCYHKLYQSPRKIHGMNTFHKMHTFYPKCIPFTRCILFTQNGEIKGTTETIFNTLKMEHGPKIIGHVFYHPKLKNSNMFFGQCVPTSKNPTRDTVFDHPAPNCP